MKASARLSEPIAAPILMLLKAAEMGRLAVCAGAGLSKAPDAGLPLGGELSVALCERLEQRLAGFEPPDNPQDLIAVADAAVAASEGVSTLQQEVLELADFLGAAPNLGHWCLGLLLAEGAVSTVLLWNWDSCIERSVCDGERIEVALSEQDVADLRTPAVVKVHGCASRASTLLITSAQLAADAPPWTQLAFAQKLGHDCIVFLGVGDVADYAQHRIGQLLDEFGSADIAVVGPEVVSGWPDSAWSTVAPHLDGDKDRRIEAYADDFLDGLLRAWASGPLMELRRLRADLGGAATSELEIALTSLESVTALGFTKWCRTSMYAPTIGISAVRAPQVLTAILAACRLAAAEEHDKVEFQAFGRISTPSQDWAVVAVDRHQVAASIERRLTVRAQRLAEAGHAPGSVVFLVSGPVIDGLAETFSTQIVDVFAGDVPTEDVLAGPAATEISILWADSVLAGGH
jgi:hypothetical protein